LDDINIVKKKFETAKLNNNYNIKNNSNLQNNYNQIEDNPQNILKNSKNIPSHKLSKKFLEI